MDYRRQSAAMGKKQSFDHAATLQNAFENKGIVAINYALPYVSRIRL